MEVKVKLKYLRVAPRKARLVADLIRGKTVEEAETQLDFTTKKAALSFKKLLKSGVATAENDFGLRRGNLKITEVKVDEGPTLKRVRPRARGAFYPIHKRTSHLTLKLGQIEKLEPRKIKKAEPEKEEAEEVREEGEKRSLKKAPKGPSMKQKRGKRKGIFRRKAF